MALEYKQATYKKPSRHHRAFQSSTYSKQQQIQCTFKPIIGSPIAFEVPSRSLPSRQLVHNKQSRIKLQIFLCLFPILALYQVSSNSITLIGKTQHSQNTERTVIQRFQALENA